MCVVTGLQLSSRVDLGMPAYHLSGMGGGLICSRTLPPRPLRPTSQLYWTRPLSRCAPRSSLRSDPCYAVTRPRALGLVRCVSRYVAKDPITLQLCFRNWISSNFNYVSFSTIYIWVSKGYFSGAPTHLGLTLLIEKKRQQWRYIVHPIFTFRKVISVYYTRYYRVIKAR